VAEKSDIVSLPSSSWVRLNSRTSEQMFSLSHDSLLGFSSVADKVVQVEIVRSSTAAASVSGSTWVKLSHDDEASRSSWTQLRVIQVRQLTVKHIHRLQ